MQEKPKKTHPKMRFFLHWPFGHSPLLPLFAGDVGVDTHGVSRAGSLHETHRGELCYLHRGMTINFPCHKISIFTILQFTI